MSMAAVGMDVEWVPGFAGLGIAAFTTTRSVGDFALLSPQPSEQVWGRWLDLAALLPAPRLAFAYQVHGVEIVMHSPSWKGILRVPEGDGHLAVEGATAMAVSLADCVPVFIGHPSGVGAVLHSGWKGTAGGIVRRAITALSRRGFQASDLVVHCGPAICGKCYEVGVDVFRQITGRETPGPAPVDLRARIAADAAELGVNQVSISDSCTRCHNDRFFSHRAGDAGRQLGVLVTRDGDRPEASA
jgi:YfiH family protein